MNRMDGLVFFILLLSSILLIVLTSRKKVQMRAEELERAVDSLTRRVTVVTSDSVPGKEIIKVMGSVTGESEVGSPTKLGLRIAELEAMMVIMHRALTVGANAIVDFKISTSHYQQQGSKETISKTCSGSAVRIQQMRNTYPDH